MQLHDALTIFDAKETRDGYFVARCNAARAGIYEYLGREVDPSATKFAADAVVRVYRPVEEVFAADSMASFYAKPVTNDHPTVPVNPANWLDYARGTVMGGKRRVVGKDEYLAFDIALMDAATIADVKAGKVELSNGYACDVAFESGTTDDGQAFDAVQRNIRGNHVAIVAKGRAGSKCRIGDGAKVHDPRVEGFIGHGTIHPLGGGNAFAICDANPSAIQDLAKERSTMTKYVHDGLPVDLADASAVTALLDKLKSNIADGAKALADATAANDKAMAGKDAEIDALKAKAIDAAEIDRIADEKADLATKAKALLGDKAPDLKGKTLADARRMIVAAKLGDAVVADKSDDYVAARFDGLADAVVVDANKVVPLIPRATVSDNGSAVDALRRSRYS